MQDIIIRDVRLPGWKPAGTEVLEGNFDTPIEWPIHWTADKAESPPWVLKGGYALEPRFKDARSTVDIDLTAERVPATARGRNQIVREMPRGAGAAPLGGWYESTAGPAPMDLNSAVWGRPLSRRSPEGGTHSIFARFHEEFSHAVNWLDSGFLRGIPV
ncbi:MAG: nucleotidyl transferase AbiEii/AbiGii toxin family protein [Bryobacterales bacterium]|nr:nucleotidyl transferase AbiEii/AbiGii toxin family protein [Bryobacterales bacterium]